MFDWAIQAVQQGSAVAMARMEMHITGTGDEKSF